MAEPATNARWRATPAAGACSQRASGERMSAQTPICAQPRRFRCAARGIPSAATRSPKAPSSRARSSRSRRTSPSSISAPRPKAVWPSRNSTAPAVTSRSKSAPKFEVYVDRIENCARRSRHLPREGAPGGKLDQAREGLRGQRACPGPESSIRSRVVTPSISTAPWPSCPARRSIFAPCAT